MIINIRQGIALTKGTWLMTLILQYFQANLWYTFISAFVILFNREILAKYTRDNADNMEDCGFHSKQCPSCPSAGHHRQEFPD